MKKNKQKQMFKIFLLLFIIFVVAGSAEEWDASSYPNPTSNGYLQCNMKSPASLCDPDKVLTESERYRINYELNQLESRTRQPQSDNFCAKRGIVAAVAFAKHVRGGSENAVKVMANDMLKKWTLDKQCGKSLVIVVSTEDRKFWVARDTRVPVYATEFTDLFNAQKPLFKEGNYHQALLNVISGTWEKALSKQAPATNDGSSRGAPFMPSNPQRPGGGKKSGGGFDPSTILSKIPLWVWLALFLVVIPTLCCCCCFYLCCCRKKNGETNNKRQSIADDDPNAGNRQRNGGGGNFLQSVISGASSAAIVNTITNCIRSRNSGQNQPSPNDGPYQPSSGSGGYQPVAQPKGQGLYPSIEVKDEGGGGQW